jgi:hypothetical protein
MKRGKVSGKSGNNRRKPRAPSTARAKSKKPRGEILLDRIDQNPNDRAAWNELAAGLPAAKSKLKPGSNRLSKKPTR